MQNRKIRILQVNSIDQGGGAAKIAWILFQEYLHRGYSSKLLVGKKIFNDENVLLIPNFLPNNIWEQFWFFLANKIGLLIGKIKGFGFFKKIFINIGRIGAFVNIKMGHEDFYYPQSRKFFEKNIKFFDIIHCHNLHKNFFDLKILPDLSNKIPVIFTLHDAWLLTGHCAHFFDCNLWQTGCKKCKYLDIYCEISRDAAAYNKKKLKIYSESRLYISTPCNWLADKVEKSILKNGVCELRVINNGIDLNIFYPKNKRLIKDKLNILNEYKILLFLGVNNSWKDYDTLEKSLKLLSNKIKDKIVIFCFGKKQQNICFGNIEIIFKDYEMDQDVLADYYNIADIYIHSTKADTFPNSILEALACGTPVIGTDVGGIREQIRDFKEFSDISTGILVEVKNETALSEVILFLLKNDDIRLNMGKNAIIDAKNRFDLNRQASEYLSWYNSIISGFKKPK